MDSRMWFTDKHSYGAEDGSGEQNRTDRYPFGLMQVLINEMYIPHEYTYSSCSLFTKTSGKRKGPSSKESRISFLTSLMHFMRMT